MILWQEIKSDFNLEILYFIMMGFTSYSTCLESLKKHSQAGSGIHLVYNRVSRVQF